MRNSSVTINGSSVSRFTENGAVTKEENTENTENGKKSRISRFDELLECIRIHRFNYITRK